MRKGRLTGSKASEKGPDHSMRHPDGAETYHSVGTEGSEHTSHFTECQKRQSEHHMRIYGYS